MKTTKMILLVVLLACIVLVAVFCTAIRQQTKQEIVHEYQMHKEAFEYVKEYFIANDLSGIQRDNSEITMRIRGSSIITSLEDTNDELLIQYVRLLFDDLHYSWIDISYTWKENIMQLMFLKETNKIYYYKEIVYCADNEPPISTALFTDVEQIDNYWFYCEEDADEDLF